MFRSAKSRPNIRPRRSDTFLLKFTTNYTTFNPPPELPPHLYKCGGSVAVLELQGCDMGFGWIGADFGGPFPDCIRNLWDLRWINLNPVE